MSTHTNQVQSYTISEAAQLSGLPESTLRYYESIGLIAPITRDSSSKHRTYSEEDVAVIVSVACLSATGMSIEDMRTYLSNRSQGAQDADVQIELLTSQRERLIEEARLLKFRQRYVDAKIAYWHAVSNGDTKQAEAIGKDASAIAKNLKPTRR